ncbi:DUF488 family protein [Streptomyces somaliensis DSM 40738]|uniref:DUF488 family protein n=1 Tax=Streptomyces somaliensis (strain ATCC 33201 / DSM 40738 / JCM 12659 / KCTC 9044 / NCTC 11332 / NRRL B-12077 / IP 733) TaxID=1134445 RepID=A0AA44DFE1_STRE0|nr:DUF488 family protein [Streptomyces somaliensis DSM 40738]
MYEPPEPGDGARVLVDRLWPRGLAKADARIDHWPRSLTPSSGLRRWFHAADGTSDEVFDEFRRRYEAELEEPGAAEALDRVRELAGRGPLTLLTAARDPERSHAAVLRALLGGG